MVDGGLVVAPPGWFTDPIGRSDLRWWTGAEWTEHVAASPVDDPTDVSRPVASEIPLPGTFVPLQPEPSAYVPFGGDRSGENSDARHPRSWASTVPTRWNTGGAWALSATPLIGVLSGVGIIFAVTFSVWLALAIVLLPLLWTVAAATRDRSTLDGYGYSRVPSRWWLLLGPLAYLIARTVYVRRQSGHGWAPLWWYLGIVVALSVLSVVARSVVAGLIPAG